MKRVLAAVVISLAAAWHADAAPSRERPAELGAGVYFKASIPVAGEDANSSWTGGAARFRYGLTETLAAAASFTYDRHEFAESPREVVDPGEALERQLLSFRGGAVYDVPWELLSPYVGGGLALAREKTYFRYGRLEPKVLYHPGLYAEAGTNVPLIGPLTVDAGPELAVLFGKRVAAFDTAGNDYRYDDGAALYFGVKAGLAIYF
jgi:hypothetical protein